MRVGALVRGLVIGVVLVLAAGAVALSVVSLSRSNSASSRGAALRATIRALDRRLGALEAELASNGSASKAEVTQIATCLPELKAYVDGIQPQVTNGNVYLTYTQQISSVCAPVLNGPSGGP